jgi:hypothetical protein
MTKTFSEKIDRDFGVSFSSTFLVLSRFQVLLSDGSSKHDKKRFVNKSCRRVTKKSTKKQKIQNRFFLILFNRVFGRFSVRGVQKHDKKYRENLTNPRNQPTTSKSVIFFLRAPWFLVLLAARCSPPVPVRAAAASSAACM